MNTLEEYMKLPYPIEITPDKDEGGYVASYPDLKGCITCGQTIESATVALVDAKRAWLKAALESGYEIPVPNNSDFHTLKSDETLLSVSKQILDKNRQAYEKLSKS